MLYDDIDDDTTLFFPIDC